MPLYNLQWNGKIDQRNLTAWSNKPILLQSFCLGCLRTRSGTSLPTLRYALFLDILKLVFADTREWQPDARLPVLENYANLRNISVSPGIFSGNKVLLVGSRADLSDEDEALEAPYPNSSYYPLPSSSFSHPESASTSLSTLPPHLSLQTPSFPRTSLPPISFLREQLNPPPQPRSPFSGYFPLSSEDRRALDKFKTILWGCS